MRDPRTNGKTSPPSGPTRPVVVAVAGGSGSGKSTVSKSLVRALGERGTSAAVLAHDSYYHDLSHLTPAERATFNYDEPAALESALMSTHLDALHAGESVEVPVYDFETHTRSPQTHHQAPTQVLIVEGILLFAEATLRERFDLSVYVDLPPDLRLLRRIRRDAVERGRKVSNILDQYEKTVRPMHEHWVDASAHHADLRLDGNRSFDDLTSEVVTAIEARLTVAST